MTARTLFLLVVLSLYTNLARAGLVLEPNYLFETMGSYNGNSGSAGSMPATYKAINGFGARLSWQGKTSPWSIGVEYFRTLTGGYDNSSADTAVTGQAYLPVLQVWEYWYGIFAGYHIENVRLVAGYMLSAVQDFGIGSSREVVDKGYGLKIGVLFEMFPRVVFGLEGYSITYTSEHFVGTPTTYSESYGKSAVLITVGYRIGGGTTP